jgi:tetrapyrrole methylase family protein/MazG family protein
MRAKRKTIQKNPSTSYKKRLLSAGIPEGLPSLSTAYHLTEQASRLGFDWPDLQGILTKLDEELTEFREALAFGDRGRIREEIGDLLFVVVNICRFLRIHPERALRKTIEKFICRFDYVETSLRKQGKSFLESNLLEMDRLWEEAKRKKVGR